MTSEICHTHSVIDCSTKEIACYLFYGRLLTVHITNACRPTYGSDPNDNFFCDCLIACVQLICVKYHVSKGADSKNHINVFLHCLTPLCNMHYLNLLAINMRTERNQPDGAVKCFTV